jgi:hypothetical protein
MASPLDTLRRLHDARRLALSCARSVASDASHTGRPGWPNHNVIAVHEAAVADISRAMEVLSNA